MFLIYTARMLRSLKPATSGNSKERLQMNLNNSYENFILSRTCSEKSLDQIKSLEEVEGKDRLELVLE